MKKIFISALSAVAVMSVSVPSCAIAAEKPETSAKASVLISADTGEIICSENFSEMLPMASTTKIMTTLLCLESGGLYDEFTVDSDAIHVEGSSMGLVDGDIVTKYALCVGMLLPSGNDAANATAVKLAGSQEKFAEMMNDKAAELGLSHTHFVTPSGLEGEGHKSSAYDMAMLAREALKNEVFRSICSSESMAVEFGNPPYKRWLKNTNKLLSMYDGVYGVKTGFTDEAGRCLVSACERDGIDLICVTLNDRNDWDDHMALYDFGFETAKTMDITIPDSYTARLAGSDKTSLKLKAEADPLPVTTLSEDGSEFSFEVIAPPFVYAPVAEGDEVAELRLNYKGREVERIPLFAAENAEYSTVPEKSGISLKNIIEKLIGKT
ncbi:MAG: D-alanyl-D-alanine carboxypeptidase [Ruminococcus sp.]|nr:D-alanyl-D-alanine carboxypeptidase [Ruminococcus sp.]